MYPSGGFLMSTNIDIRSRYSTATSIIAIALGVLFLYTACSTFISRQTSQPSQDKTPMAKATAIQESATVAETGRSPSVDKAMDDWEKARAAYLRTLDYEKIEQQNDKHDEYLLKSNLVESRYHIKTSDAAMFVEHDYRKALHELQAAEQRLIQAIKMASSKELPGLDNTKSDVDQLLTQAKLSAHDGCEYANPHGYHQVEARLEHLLGSL
jgi:hypothetical protein